VDKANKLVSLHDDKNKGTAKSKAMPENTVCKKLSKTAKDETGLKPTVAASKLSKLQWLL